MGNRTDFAEVDFVKRMTFKWGVLENKIFDKHHSVLEIPEEVLKWWENIWKVNENRPLTIFAKTNIADIRLGSK